MKRPWQYTTGLDRQLSYRESRLDNAAIVRGTRGGQEGGNATAHAKRSREGQQISRRRGRQQTHCVKPHGSLHPLDAPRSLSGVLLVGRTRDKYQTAWEEWE